ncbi:MAG: DEAD/DEAH box helicase [Planctomycetes bacterium]|nr:DEAD/DEAH box helicase [Planctomycetota bacterium]
MPARPDDDLRLEQPLTALRGVGPKRAETLARDLGVRTLGGLLQVLPRRYHEPGRSTPLAELVEGELARVRVRVVSCSLWRRGGRSSLQVRVEDDSAAATATWFNMPYLKDSFPPGRELVLEGRASRKQGLRLYGPRVVPEAEQDAADPLPVYPEVEGLGPHQLRRLLAAALELAGPIPDPLPEEIRQAAGVPELDQALRLLHAPRDLAGLDRARRRLAWGEVLRLERRRLQRRQEVRPAPLRRACDPQVWSRIEARLPFRLTREQQDVLALLRADLGSGGGLTRLLHGEVGSGKTAIAFALALAFAAEGSQTAILAPTEILARQHLATFRSWLTGARLEVAGLLGDDPSAERRRTLERLRSGRAAIAIGTHALFGPAVRFQQLACVVFDEQHRFGVRQKAALLAKGASPSVLTMTATPIPRTLAWARYGALEPCVLRSRPGTGGRIRTRLADQGTWLQSAREWRPLLEAGQRLFVVAPRIDGAGGLLERAAELFAGPWRGLSGAVVHGRLPGAEVAAAVARFAAGEVPVLLGTTVVEVGLDVADVPRMAVLEAHRLGLASLHQLRGRLARGPAAGDAECWLFADPTALERLEVLERHPDGFAIAEADLAARGPGALRGLRQHGRSDFQLFDPVRDGDLVRALALPKVRSWLQAGD